MFFRVNLILTRNCNLNCIYCSLKKTGEKMNSLLIKKIIQMIINSKAKEFEIHFFGGEPLLEYKTIKKTVTILNHLKKKGFGIKYIVTTNGTLLNKQKLDYLTKNNFRLCLSVDGDKKVQQKNRVALGNQDSYDWLENNLEYITNKKLDAQVTLVINQNNIENLAYNFFHIKDLGIKNIYLSLAFEGSKMKIDQSRFLSVFKKELDKITKRLNKDIGVLDNVKNSTRFRIGNEVSGISIDCNGDVYYGEESCWLFENAHEFNVTNIKKYNSFDQLRLELNNMKKTFDKKKIELRKQALGKGYDVAIQMQELINKLSKQ